MRFAANISTMFTDMILVDRFNEAKASGFSAVEAQWVYDYSIPELDEARTAAEIPIVLMNSHKSFDTWKFDTPPFGLACSSFFQVDFIKSMSTCSQYCDFLKCHKLHIMAGTIPVNSTLEECESIYVENLKIASDILEKYNVVGVIEPICEEVVPNYFLNSFRNAIKYINAVDKENIKLLLDVFHLHNIEGNVEGLLDYLPYAAHIQVSQSPKRNEPLAEGDIDYERVLNLLNDNGYEGDIGLEYIPTGQDPDFEWFRRFGY